MARPSPQFTASGATRSYKGGWKSLGNHTGYRDHCSCFILRHTKCPPDTNHRHSETRAMVALTFKSRKQGKQISWNYLGNQIKSQPFVNLYMVSEPRLGVILSLTTVCRCYWHTAQVWGESDATRGFLNATQEDNGHASKIYVKPHSCAYSAAKIQSTDPEHSPQRLFIYALH